MHPSAVAAVPLACFLSMIRPPGVEFENSFLQILPIDKAKCPFVKNTNDIGFHLYTRYNPTVYEELFVGDDERLASSQIDFTQHTVIYFHAFLENAEGGSALMVREAYMLRGDTNVIMIDAQRLEAGPWYFTAADNTWYIGQFAAQFIDYLVSRGLDLSRTHLVGHSLGAQAAGVAGAALGTGKVARITGLDPAMPLFDKLPLAQKLDAGDAHFVDVIHTDAGIFGVDNPIGHADFYPNGGISPQPGCELEIVWPRQMLLEKFFCSHWRSYQFFAESVLRPSSFVATSCTTWHDFRRGLCGGRPLTRMGHGADRETHIQPKPLEGFVFINLEERPGYRQQKKNAQKTEAKITKHYQYSKAERDQKRPKSQKQNGVVVKMADDLEMSFQNPEPAFQNVKKRQKRFIPFFRRNNIEENNDNFLFRMLEFLVKNRKNVIPIVSVIREMNTLVKSANGELNHVSKERNNYIGTPPPLTAPVSFNLELGKDPPGRALLKKMLGLGSQTDRLTIGGGGGFGK